MIDNDNYEMVFCHCGGEGIMVCVGVEDFWNATGEDGKEIPLVQLAFWKAGHDETVTLRERLRLMWRIWRHGRPYADMVLLARPDAEKLIAAMQKVLEGKR